MLCMLAANRLLVLDSGHVVLLSLAAVIAAGDSAAYFVGRSLGGPKLLVAVSPNKTLSGSAGGLVAASISCVLLAEFLYLEECIRRYWRWIGAWLCCAIRRPFRVGGKTARGR